MDSRKFFYELGKSVYKLDGFYSEYAKKFDVKENLLWILYALNDRKEHSQKEICDNWALPRTTVNTIMKELENNDYVELSQIKGEKRELKVNLTEKGKNYADNLLKELYNIEKQVFEIINNGKIIEELNTITENLYKKEVENE